MNALKRLDTTSRAIEREHANWIFWRGKTGAGGGPGDSGIERAGAKHAAGPDNLRVSYEHRWRTTPESLLHTCRGLELQMQITLPDHAQGLRLKQYIRDLSVSLSSGAAAGKLPSEADVHRVSGFLWLSSGRI